MELPFIDPDIRRAETLPGWFYTDPEVEALFCERLLPQSWQLVDPACLPEPGEARPLESGGLPLVMTRDEQGFHCLSNVCTHRGAIVATEPCRTLRCPYHGRQFELDGRFRSMPGFEETLDFPRALDDLASLPVGRVGPLLFVSVRPEIALRELVGPLEGKVNWEGLRWIGSRRYTVEASWLLYCENYLEGFHLPFVHPTLSRELDLSSYTTEIFSWSSHQVGRDGDGEQGGLYAWIWPNTMLNFYAWGLSVNQVLPLSPGRCMVIYHTYVSDPGAVGKGAGGDLERVEAEDQAIIQQVQKGVGSSLYPRGRYSPRHEQGVHHFHRLLLDALSAVLQTGSLG